MNFIGLEKYIYTQPPIPNVSEIPFGEASSMEGALSSHHNIFPQFKSTYDAYQCNTNNKDDIQRHDLDGLLESGEHTLIA